jgi:hypothetical protein
MMGIVAIIIIIVVVLVVVGRYSTKQDNSKYQSIESKGKNKQTTHLRKIDLEGVWFNKGERRDAFTETQEGDTVLVTFDYENHYDKNALGVYTKSGKLLGYIPKDNKRIIGAFRRQPRRATTIIYKNDGRSQYEKEIRIEFSIA